MGITPDIKLSDYHYHLPEDRIAKFPLEKRDRSKLLHFEDGKIGHHHFYDLPELLPSDTLMVFNNTKVIPARLIFQRESGARIEIFLLQPIAPSTVINQIMQHTGSVTWQAMIGNSKKWKDGEILTGKVLINDRPLTITASLANRTDRQVTINWEDEQLPFAAVVEAAGEVPLPPYLNRKATSEDKPRYQTVYSKKEGAVAAPTAGLHFTDEILKTLSDQGIKTDYLTLHVGAGTFQPIKDEIVTHHPMHSEQVVVSKENIQYLLGHKGNIVAVGTTSMRSLESIYWYGVKLLNGDGKDFLIPKLYPYQQRLKKASFEESFRAIMDHMTEENLNEITGSTEIFIMPGYRFKVCNGLLTNFHQPASTLILLVAAFTKGHWQKIYSEALSHDYRFLSYGDSSLLWHHKKA
ncbi:S-adenosylmethionine:tRNA ribosyltransferase-isomerase [Echinicola strongylocentroti]|uniref:S-adenosylmethionine:tRNA ribosyltransferase-isomerase n=1 Tax=Echinicola strongylocentroti TaxID=1795355 RepID=A0A2Z4IEB0_9BACT|nr:S-adenosylmethionine:tRNA ribosyltransferase-isomerase [Echinicola strongylocentroti]AWW29007.1 S-adenosylmethionine:tRNA ribosyltransferase-isomerase [Echinicola strongylocentroti]